MFHNIFPNKKRIKLEPLTLNYQYLRKLKKFIIKFSQVCIPPVTSFIHVLAMIKTSVVFVMWTLNLRTTSSLNVSTA